MVPSPRTIMSTVPSVSTSRSNFVSVFDAALETYKRRTKKDLATHSLLPTLQSCDSPEAVLVVLREQIPAFSPTQNDDDGLTKWVSPTVNVLYTISANLGGGVGLVSIMMFSCQEFANIYSFQAFPPANAIFAGISVFLSVGVLHDSLVQTIDSHGRRFRIPVLAKKGLLTSLTALNISSAGLRFTLALHRQQL